MSTPTTTPATPLSREDVVRIARLAKLELSEAQIEDARQRLGKTLDYMRGLAALDVSGLMPLTAVGNAHTRLDEDVPAPMLSNAELMAMAPAPSEPFIAVPKVIGDGGGA